MLAVHVDETMTKTNPHMCPRAAVPWCAKRSRSPCLLDVPMMYRRKHDIMAIREFNLKAIGQELVERWLGVVI